MKVWLFGFCFLSISSLAGQYQLFEENGRVGMKDEQGAVVIPAAFEALGWSDKSFSVIENVTGYRLNSKWGLINLKKEKITQPLYDELYPVAGAYLVARKKINAVQTKSGCLNLKGEIKIPFVYDGIEVHGLRAVVFNLNGAKYNYGLIDFENHLLMPLDFRSIRALGTLRFAMENMEKKFALFSEDGKPVTDFVIDSVSNFRKSYAIFHQNLLQGLIDREGNIRLEARFAQIRIDDEGKVFAKEPDEWQFINQENKVSKRIAAERLVPFGKNYLYSNNGYWGIMDENYVPVVKAAYHSLQAVSESKIIATKNSKMGVINLQGETILPFENDSLFFEISFYRSFQKNTGWYLLDENGKTLTKKYYQFIGKPQSEKFPVKNLGYWGLINSNGDEFIHCVFDSVQAAVADRNWVKFKGKYGVINDNENWLVPPQENKIQIINADRYLLTTPDNQFIMSFSGEVIYFSTHALQFEREYFLEHLPDGNERKLDYHCVRIEEPILPERTEEVFRESEGMIGFKRDRRFGFVDKQGRIRVANRYDSIGEFHDGLAAIKLIGKWGFVTTTDKIAIQPNYDSAANFESGLCIVSRAGNFGVINKEGKVVLPLRYSFVKRLPEEKFLLIQNSLLGLADKHGSVFIEPRFDSLDHAAAENWIACHRGKCGVVSSSGLDRIPMVYDRLLIDKNSNQFLALKKSAWKEVYFK